ncbi:hypothetical protein [Sedimenticola selenatireducens]|uniref:hypothetical protein n=1 Tax=Sedimenticola selenatireducens TaxID=191960 RepID=UPI0004912B89|nr:hypothetical protein [Sedimenticola selenatireducens]
MNNLHRVQRLSEIEIRRKARDIVAALIDVAGMDAMMIVNQALSIILRESLTVSPPPGSQVYPFNPNLIRRGRVSKIDADPAVKAFIHSLPVYHGVARISALCVERFGKARAPSKNTVHRYLQKLSKRYPKGKTSE